MSVMLCDAAITCSDTPAEKHCINLNDDFEIPHPLNGTITAMEFSPDTLQKNLLVAGTSEKSLYLWDVQQSQAIQRWTIDTSNKIFDVCWSADGKSIYLATDDHSLKTVDVGTMMKVSTHQHHAAPITSCHFIKTPNCASCIMTSSQDNTIKMWDSRSQNSVVNVNFYSKISCVDVDYPMAVACTELGKVFIFNLKNGIELEKELSPPFQSERHSVAIFRNKRTQIPAGFGLGTKEGRVFTIYNEKPSHDIFQLYRHGPTNVMTPGEGSYNAVNDIKFHPIFGTLAIARNNGTYSFWDMEPPKVIRVSEKLNRPIEKCCFDSSGHTFAYSISYNGAMRTTSKSSIYFNKRCYIEPKFYFTLTEKNTSEKRKHTASSSQSSHW